MPLFHNKIFRLGSIAFLCFFFFIRPIRAEELFLEPVVQGTPIEEIIPVFRDENNYYIQLEALAASMQFNLSYSPNPEVAFSGHKYPLNFSALSAGSYKIIDRRYYLTPETYEQLLGLKMQVNLLDMQLNINSNTELPITQKLQSLNRRQNMLPLQQYDSYNNYQFDNRNWSTPVFDLTLQNNYNIRDNNSTTKKRWNHDYYQLDFGMLAAGLDTYASIFGDSENNNHSPRSRITVGRTFLDEPKNALNLTSFEAGDVTGFNSTLFNNSANGRGLYASSFKDLVLSADKTIDINGPLSAGWEVELYLNNQLIGFRQAGLNGRYQFSNIPVNFGLNSFKLVFYGPYGEIQTEERNYYSGTSPVKSGEFGYTLNAYQKDHYLFEKNEPWINPSNKPTLDFTGYYGIDDNTTAIAGISQTANPATDDIMNLGTAGLQYIYDGASLQYNAMFDLDNKDLGHHFDIQGDVKIGTIFARYDYYGSLEAPIAYYNDEFMKDIGEIRLSGFLPYRSLPYYISYLERNSVDGDKTQEFHTRLSPNFMQYYNFTAENIWTKDKFGKSNDILLLLQAQYYNLGVHSQLRYRLEPDTYLHNLNQQVDYRWDKYTYFQFNWDRDCRSQYSGFSDLDTFSISAGRLFDFGGLNLALSTDTDKNSSISLTYNISFGKVPQQYDVFTDSRTKMSERGAIYAKVEDEAGKPIQNTKLQISGIQEPVKTDKNGEALITDIEPYQKTVLTVNSEEIEDIALVPEFENKKLVLRPGTVLPLKIRFDHKGGLEGFIIGNYDFSDCKIALLTPKGKTIISKTPETDGSFIFDNITFGQYELAVFNDQHQRLYTQPVNLNQPFLSLTDPLKLH